MKKTIKVLLDKMGKLQEMKDGTIQGGFASIKGGFVAALDSTNDNWGCSNTVNCTHSTNTSTPGCTNSGTCFM